MVVRRLGQERTMNIKEIAQQNKHIEKMKAEGRDEYDIKKQVRFVCILHR
jgi:tubulin-specific chaperone A